MHNTTHLGAVAGRAKNHPLQDGTHAELRTLTLADLAFIQEEAAAAARRELIETYAKNMDMLAVLPQEKREQVVLDAFKRAEEITSDNVAAVRVTRWMEQTLRGQLTCIWLSMRHAQPGLTFDQAADIWATRNQGEPPAVAAAVVTELTRPTVKNESPPPATEAAGVTGTGLA